MKASYALSALILAAAACLGWRDHQEFVSTRTKSAALLAEASSLGLSPDPAHPREKVLVAHERDNRAKLTSAEYIAFMKELMRKENEGTDQETMRRTMAFLERVSALEPDEFKRLVADLRSTPDFSEESRNGPLIMALMGFSTRHPETVLTLLANSPDLSLQAHQKKHLAAAALRSWAESDPVAGVKWVKENEEKASDFVDDGLKQGLLSGSAKQDPKLAFQFIADLKFDDTVGALSAIVREAKTPEDRTATLDALREYASTLEDTKVRAYTNDHALALFADQVTEDGFQNAIQWFDSMKLSATELRSFSKGISYDSITPGETGQWIDWMEKTLPTDEASKQISSLVDDWTEKDYQAAGTWLTATLDGPVKQAAVRGYIRAVAPYEPETAAQWAMTLPPGKDREAALKTVYQKWPKKDPATKAAAEAFADQHGIQH